MFLLLIPLLLVILYFYLTRNHNYWAKLNIKYERPVVFFGNFYDNVVGKKSVTEMTTEIYNKYPNEKAVGIYRGTVPELVIRDLDIARNILSVDFACFYPRGLGRNSKKEKIFANLFHADGDQWKLLRQRMSAAFTSAKLKKMFPLIIECAEKLQNVGEDIVNKGGDYDIRELMARFTTEFIGACGFGLQLDSISNEDSLFRRFGKIIFDRNRSFSNAALVILHDLIPEFGRVLQNIFIDHSLFNTTQQMVRNVCAERNYKPSGRHDFIDLLLELAAKGTVTGESMEKKTADGTPVIVETKIDEDCMVAQVFVFFAAGFETSSSATSYLLHELAFHPEEQKKIQDEIDQVLAQYNNKMCYESIEKMKRLSMAFNEAMRKFPSLGTLHRMCAKRYPIPELGVTLDPGVKVIIPVQAIQMDGKYFENPTQFKPERFAEDEINKYSYLPFGIGPRMCIGARLGEMQSLAGLVAVLHKFSVEPSPLTKRTLDLNHLSNTVQSIEGGIPLRLKLREKRTIAA